MRATRASGPAVGNTRRGAAGLPPGPQGDARSEPGARRPGGFREPRQSRSRRTLARIAGATEELLAERGVEGVTVQEVIARADASVGAFYARFDSKDDAVAYVRGRFWEESERLWAEFLDPERWRGVAAVPLVAEVIRRCCRVILGPGSRARAFLLELLSRSEPELLERMAALDREVAARMGRLVAERSGQLDLPDAAGAAEEGFLRVLSAVRDFALFSVVTGGAPERERRLILSLAQMYARLLGLEATPGSYRELLRLCRESATGSRS